MAHVGPYTRTWIEDSFPGGRWVKRGDEDAWLIPSPLRPDSSPSFALFPSRLDGGGGNAIDEARQEGFKISEVCKQLGIEDAFKGNGATKSAPSPTSPLGDERKAGATLDDIRALWEKSKPATAEHFYIKKKGLPFDDLRVTPGGWLCVPQFSIETGELVGIERIAPHEKRNKDDITKRQYGKRLGGVYTIGDTDDAGTIFVSEGLATGHALHRITGEPVVVAFSSGEFPKRAPALMKRWPDTEIVLCPDCDDAGISSAEKAVGASVLRLPDGLPKGMDWDDVLRDRGLDVAREMLCAAWDNRKVAEGGVVETERPKRSILDVVKSPSPGTAVKPEKVWHFPRKHLNLVAADSGMGKSLLITKIAADLSIGAPVLETTAEPIRKTLYLNGECGRDYFDWRFLSSGWEYSEEHFKVLHQEDLAEDGIDLDLDTPQGRKNLEILLDGIGPDLLVIDSLPAFSSEDMNDGTVQNEIGKYLKQLAIKHNLALVLITHLRKRRLQDQGAEPTLSEIQGSNAAAKLCNVALAIFEKVVEIDGEERTVKVCKSVKSWGRQVAPFGFCFPELDEDTLTIEMVDVPQSKQLSGSWERVRDGLRHTEFSRQAVESLLEVSDKTAKKLLYNWIQQGKIERVGTGKGTSYIVRGSTVHTLPRIAANPVIATNDTGKSKFPESEPQEENHSGKNTFPEATSVIPRVYKNTGKYIDGASPQSSPNEKYGEVPCNDSGNLVCLLSERTPSLGEGFEDEPNPFMIDEEDE